MTQIPIQIIQVNNNILACIFLSGQYTTTSNIMNIGNHYDSTCIEESVVKQILPSTSQNIDNTSQKTPILALNDHIDHRTAYRDQLYSSADQLTDPHQYLSHLQQYQQ